MSFAPPRLLASPKSGSRGLQLAVPLVKLDLLAGTYSVQPPSNLVQEEKVTSPTETRSAKRQGRELRAVLVSASPVLSRQSSPKPYQKAKKPETFSEQCHELLQQARYLNKATYGNSQEIFKLFSSACLILKEEPTAQNTKKIMNNMSKYLKPLQEASPLALSEELFNKIKAIANDKDCTEESIKSKTQDSAVKSYLHYLKLFVRWGDEQRENDA